jgi:uncharacterized protein (TIGR02246 family)
MPSRRREARRLAAALAGLLLLQAPAAIAGPIADPRQSVDIFREAMAAGDAEAIAGLFAENAILLAPTGEAFGGRDAIRAVYQRNFDAGRNTIVFDEVQFEAGSDRAVMLWLWHLTIENAGTTRGRSMLYWRRTDAGWEIVADMFQAVGN